ncbi:hypothetical protein EDD28_1626 [Salana multivorans]|uniref:Uncharacterized protein n=1 Tax=Salana multivorans TaxID=120377 RepID=A0A3N2DBB3_9MICO|nr:hypothetical protein [Salana multivorans]ROR97033.1 hypothetical protein EDD28_1626 [Salana multivorans]
MTVAGTRFSPARTRAAVAIVLGGLLVAGCTGTQVLPPDPPIAEPGYPEYTPPASPAPSPRTSTSAPTPPSSPASPTPDRVRDPASPSPTKAVPRYTPTPAPPAPEPEPEQPTTPDAPEPTPTRTATPSPTSSPRPSPSPTPTPLTLTTVTWDAACGSSVDLVSPNRELTLVLSALPDTPSGSPLNATGSLSTQVETVSTSFTVEVVVLRGQVVVATSPGASDASPQKPLKPGAPLSVPVEHDLLTECAPPPSESAEPPTAPTSPARDGVSVDAAGADTRGDAAGAAAVGSAAAGGRTTTALPPGSYTVVVAVRVAAGPGAPGVVATASGPLTIT